MIYKITFFFLLLGISIQAQEWKQMNEKTKVSFTIKNFGVNVDGSFHNVEINTNFSKNNLSESYINSKIRVESIETGIKGRDKHILKEDFFYKDKFEFIELKSIKIENKTKDNYSLYANLTIRGVSKQIKIPLVIEETENTLSFKSDFEINRRDFSVGGGSLVMSKKVKIHVEYFGRIPG